MIYISGPDKLLRARAREREREKEREKERTELGERKWRERESEGGELVENTLPLPLLPLSLRIQSWL